MAQNLIVCSDGTGNKGGYGADSNVFKIYQYLDLREKPHLSDAQPPNNRQQKAIYDHGVGTSNFAPLKALGGAIGLGFKKNVLDGYNFLCRHYKKDDHIYLFGFSRGAATVRALAGLIQTCGLIDCTNPDMLSKPIDALLQEAYTLYRQYQDDPLHNKLADWRSTHPVHCFHNGENIIHFMGIWDTVSALGFPEKMGQGMGLLFDGLNGLLKKIGWIKHRYQADLAVKQVFHALAIDDNRVAFMPQIWNEQTQCRQNMPKIEQVWFAGCHSNVGGGYPRAGLSNVALYWMMRWAESQGLQFSDNAVATVRAQANVDDILYNPRDGFAALFRYSARDVEELCYAPGSNSKNGKITAGNIKIHDSVLQRMRDDILQDSGDPFGYAPPFLPEQFKIVSEAAQVSANSKPNDPFIAECRQVSSVTERVDLRKKLLKIEGKRRLLFFFFGWLVGFLALFTWSLWQNIPHSMSFSNSDWQAFPYSLLQHVAEVFSYLLPGMFKPVIYYILVGHAELLLLLTVVAGVMLSLKKRLAKKSARFAVEMRTLILNHKPCPQSAPDASQQTKPTVWFDHRKGSCQQTVRTICGWLFFLVASIWFIGNMAFALTIHERMPTDKTRSLSASDSAKTIAVFPKQYWNASGIKLEQGVHYQIELDKNSYWYDESQQANAWGWLNWQNAGWHLKIAAHLWARVPEQPLFLLMATIKESNCQQQIGRSCGSKTISLAPDPETACNADKDSGKVTYNFIAPITGDLFTFANDLPFLYGNNGTKALHFTIRRLPAE
ncbi:DUF2235 domain-containing protein [Candidatus Magnetaquicoccus inordinatus]|uniref:DUF2235 domain-containing protein n=1 Tax=Candidatus Magnetaquicoccus inordinatus TaxID=2496818 RepID=UPI00102AA167|nr:DUF2235 domain-containing protein [Candidatus Magnetaquicoccus inordinatus]